MFDRPRKLLFKLPLVYPISILSDLDTEVRTLAPNPSIVLSRLHPDFTPSNILRRVSGINDLSEAEIYQRLGNPELDPVRLATGEAYVGNHAPSALVERVDFGKMSQEYLTDDIVIVDFGQTFRLCDPPIDGVGTPEAYRAPEALLDRKASSSSDIWSLACVLFEIRGSEQLFQNCGGDQDDVVRQIVQMFGKLPEPWWKSWGCSALFFDEDG